MARTLVPETTLTIYQGETFTLRVPLLQMDELGVATSLPFDPSGYTARGQIRASWESGAALLATLLPYDQGILTGHVSYPSGVGYVDFVVDDAVTAALTPTTEIASPAATPYHDAELVTTVQGIVVVHKISRGPVVIYAEATR